MILAASLESERDHCQVALYWVLSSFTGGEAMSKFTLGFSRRLTTIILKDWPQSYLTLSL